MSVTNYNPSYAEGCKYRYERLKDVIFLVSKDHVKNIHIDNGDAYIDDLREPPLVINGFNVQLNETSSLDDRYKFDKTVTMSVKGYATHEAFSGKYYVILQSEDGTYWFVNPDFPTKVTYRFTLDASNNKTDFTFKLQSNYPVLRLLTALNNPYENICKTYNVMGIDSLRLLETDYCSIDDTNKTVYTFGESFKTVEFLKNTCSLIEEFNGERASTTITFDIGFDAYKSSWHYNLLEFLQNLYAAIVVPKNGDNVFYSGFNFGLQPNFEIQAGQSDVSDKITITLVEMSNHGLVAANDYDESGDTDTTWVYVERVGGYKTYECIGFGLAKYLVMAEINAKGVQTGNYKVLEGYDSQFPNLNITGHFTDEVTFSNSECGSDDCKLYTNMPNTITFDAIGCKRYTLSSSCNWSIRNLPSYITITPSYGSPMTSYYLNVCNTQNPSSPATGTFDVVYGNNTEHFNVIVGETGGILTPSTQNINCLSQNVSFNITNPDCPITVTSISDSLTYRITNSQLIVTVPRNNTSSSITWPITVKDCNNNTQTVNIIQDKTYENWVGVDGYICVGNDSYTRQERYTGTTASNINTATGEYRAGTLIQTGDSRCGSKEERWQFYDHYYCIDGHKVQCLEQEVRHGGGSWTKTGITKLGDDLGADAEFCALPVSYSWVQSIKYICDSEL
jgi:hypothetical protein